MMVFILSMCLYGLSNMFTELVPSVEFGPIELSIDAFAFIPLALCMLFHPLYAAIGASTGKLILASLCLVSLVESVKSKNLSYSLLECVSGG